MRAVFALISFSLVSFVGLAQTTGNIAGIVKGKDNAALPNATIRLLRSNDSAMVKTAIPQADGAFELESIKFGKYLVSISHVGHKTHYSAAITLSDAQPSHSLGEVSLQPSSSDLTEVTVSSKKPLLERKLDRVVMNVESMITAAGSSAFELLEKAPAVIIDQNDNISLKGKQGVIVMINGKPSGIAGRDLANYLRGLPASSIEKIEVITNPSAKYDAAGNAGILNIVIKKDARFGTNGTLTASAGHGRYGKTAEGISLNNRNKKINTFGSYNHTYRKFFSNLKLYRKFIENGILDGVYDQDNFIVMPFNTHIARFGMDYYANKKTTLGFVVNGLSNKFKTIGDNNTDVLDGAEQAVSNNFNTNRSADHWYNLSVNGNIRHVFDSTGKELTVDLDYARFGNSSDQNFTTKYYKLDGSTDLPTEMLAGDIDGKLTIRSIKADYVHPLKKQLKLEAGFKLSYVNADNDLAYYNTSSGTPVFDPNQSNHFIYDENINAAYLNVSKEWKKVNIMVGLRTEQTNIKGNQLATSEKFDSSYIKLFPSAFINYTASPKHTLGLSVSRRLDRPTYRQLNPFKFFINNSTYSEGNPYLQPQFTYSFEASHTYKSIITTTLSYSVTNNNITEVIFPAPNLNKITIQTNRNLARFQSYGIDISAQLKPAKWWNSVNSVNTFYGHYTGNFANTNLQNGTVSVNINSNNSFVIGKEGWVAEATAAYNSPVLYGYMKIKSSGQLNLGVQKSILDKKGSLKFNVNDVFRTAVGRATINFRDYIETFTVVRETRVATLAFTYRFGSNKVAQARRRTSGVEDEKRRAN